MAKKSIVQEAHIWALEVEASPAEAAAFAEWANNWFLDAPMAWRCWREARDA